MLALMLRIRLVNADLRERDMVVVTMIVVIEEDTVETVDLVDMEAIVVGMEVIVACNVVVTEKDAHLLRDNWSLPVASTSETCFLISRLLISSGSLRVLARSLLLSLLLMLED
jgi:hypothetical protein